VQRNNSGHYSLGFRFADVASASTAGLNLNTLAKPYLRQIAAKLNLTSMLAVLGGAESVIIATVTWARDGDVGGGAWVGRHLDLHCTAQGKALVANMPEDDLDRLLTGRELARFTSKTIDSLPALKAHLAETRAIGYSVNDEEHVLGIRAVGAPIFDSWGGVIAAISVHGSTQQIPSSRLRELGGEMGHAARNMSLQLSGK
jgi:DNA-binding IclR family transcriptional regulator